MSDTPEPQNPSQPDESAAAPASSPDAAAQPELHTPEPTSEAPEGLAPSPGIAPPAGIQPPEFQAPAAAQYAPPQYQPPQYQPPQFGPPQYQAGQPQAGQPQAGQPQDPASTQTGAAQAASDAPTQQQWTPGAPFTPQQPGQPGQPGQSGQPVGYDPSQPQGPKKGLPTGAIIGIVAGGVVLLLLIIAGVIAIGSALSRGPSPVSPAGGSTTGAQSAPAAVEEYLTALADGDAERARELVGGMSSDALLSDEVLEKSIELAPITNIEVDEETTGDDTESVVSATFDIGDETVTRDFRVWNYSDEYEIFDGLVNVSLSSFAGLDATVNGVEPSEDYAQAFIGTYQIELGVEEFALSGDTDTFTIVTDDDSSVLYEVQPVLTEEATQTFRDLVRASLTECVALTSLATPCGLDVTGPLSDGAMPIDGTIQRTLTAEGEAALSALVPEPSYDHPTVVSSYDYIQINTTLEAEKDGQRMSGDLLFGGNLLQPYVDFAQESPKVTWE